MKIVSLLGSPRSSGNSATIARHLLKTAEGLGAETTAFELNRLAYRGCQACYACKKGSEECVLNDDLRDVLEAVHAADAVVLASPVYYGDVTAQLKGFIDRTYSFLVPDYITNPKPSRLSSKKLVFVLVQGHPDETLFADVFPRYAQFLKWMEFDEVSLIRAYGIGPGHNDVVPEHALRQAEEAAKALLA
ncbi:MAG: flavodoxin family protein [Desulfuromonadaceae bacterium]|nr:flavodoxin family protein [Desulfuromonadaceae bacterium]